MPSASQTQTGFIIIIVHFYIRGKPFLIRCEKLLFFFRLLYDQTMSTDALPGTRVFVGNINDVSFTNNIGYFAVITPVPKV